MERSRPFEAPWSGVEVSLGLPYHLPTSARETARRGESLFVNQERRLLVLAPEESAEPTSGP